MPPPELFEIRRLCKEDFSNWKTLWCQYLKFYKSSVDNVVYETTFKRLISNQHTYQNALVAAQENSLIGLAHYIYHPHNWKIENVCYLQDLFVSTTIRGSGVGRALIEAVYSASDESKIPTVYWLTQDFNKQARRLYDNIGSLTPFIKYNRH